MERIGAGLVICEREGKWRAAFARQLAGEQIRIRQTRSLAECREVLSHAPASAVAVELSEAGVETQLQFVADAGRDFPAACVLVLVGRSLAAYASLASELGAAAVALSTRELRPLAEIAKRHIAAAPLAETSLTERIWAELPWPASAHATSAECLQPPHETDRELT